MDTFEVQRDEMCDQLLHYLPWMLIAAMAITAGISGLILIVVLHRRRYIM